MAALKKFHFWAKVGTVSLLGLVGFLLAKTVPLPAPFSLNQTRAIYTLVGIFLGLITFARIASWIVQTTTRLTKQLVTRLAFEIINQFTQLASRGWRVTSPFTEKVLEDGSAQSRVLRRGVMILDTSSIIDGRVLEVARTGFLSGLILLPNFILAELQQVADSADPTKRARGRFGFTVIEQLKRIKQVKIEVWDKDLAGKTVDEQLIRLGKIIHGKILTCDFNLNRVARLSGVEVLNLNELANSLKTLPIPGEKLKVKLMQAGKDKDQGVGYLEDGTMVVVKDGASLIGEEIETEVTKIIQGPAGRMVFSKLS